MVPIAYMYGFSGVSALGLFITALLYNRIAAIPVDNEKAEKIASHIRRGAMAFLRKEYSILLVVIAFAFATLTYAAGFNAACAYLLGAFSSMLAGFIGMIIATQASSRTAAASMNSLNSGLRVAFSSGAVMGLTVVGLGLLDLSVWYYFLDWYYSINPIPIALTHIKPVLILPPLLV